MPRRSYDDRAVATTLASQLTSANVTSLTVAAGGGTNYPAGPAVLTLERNTANMEKILYNSRAGDVFSGLTRGLGGTTVITHNAAASVEHTIWSGDVDEPNALVNLADAKGDLVVASAADTWARLPVGATKDHSLIVDSTQATGVKWAANPVVCTSATRPAAPYTGQIIFETDTGKVYKYYGAAWVELLDTPAANLKYTRKIAETILGANVASISITGLPGSTYAGYLLEFACSSVSNDGAVRHILMKLGGSSTSYAWSHMQVSSGAVAGAQNDAATSVEISRLSTADNQIFTHGDVEFPMGGVDSVSYVGMVFRAINLATSNPIHRSGGALWTGNSNVGSIEFTVSDGTNFRAGNRLTLYSLPR